MKPYILAQIYFGIIRKSPLAGLLKTKGYTRFAFAFIKSVVTADPLPLLLFITFVIVEQICQCSGGPNPTGEPEIQGRMQEAARHYQEDLAHQRRDIGYIIESLEYAEEVELTDLEGYKANSAFARLAHYTLPGVELLSSGQNNPQNRRGLRRFSLPPGLKANGHWFPFQ